MISIRKKHILPLLLTLLYLSPVYGQWGNEVIDYQTTIKFEKGRLVEENTYLIQINNQHSDWIAEVEIPYSNEDLEILEASVLDSHGKIVRTLKKKEISTRSAFSNITFYSDSYVKEFKLKWNQYPYRIKYSYRRVTNEFLYITKWYPVLYSNTPTRKASLSVQLPKDYAVNMDFPEQFKHWSDTLENTKNYRWEINGLVPPKEESFSPPLQERIPAVTMVPKTFTYGQTGSLESWAAYGNWQYATNQALDVLPPAEQAVVGKLIEGVTDKREIIKILYHHLQDHTRYINVAIDIGGLKPYSAAYVCTNKYGDCKALTMYMKALLKHAGIESYYTKVYADPNPVKINPKIPGQQFNHVVLCVPLQNDTLWLENTSNFLPYNYLGTFTQNRYALLVGAESKLVKTPALGLSEVLEQSNASFMLDQDGAGSLKIEQLLRGDAFENYKYLQHERSENDTREAIVANLRLKQYELLSWNITQTHRDDAQLKLQLELAVSNQLRKLGSSLVLSPAALALPVLEKPGVRHAPVRINYPVHKVDSTVYHLPFLGQYTAKLPQQVVLETKWGRYLEEYNRQGDQISCKISFQLFAGEYPKEEYEGFYTFIETIKAAQRKSAIVLNPL